MDGEVIETTETMRLVIHQDTDPANPREDYDHCSHMFEIIDRDGSGPYAHVWAEYRRRGAHHALHAGSLGLFARYVSMAGGHVHVLERPRDCSSVVFYVTRETIESEQLDPAAYLKGEAAEYEAWADGDVYGYVIEEKVTWTRMDSGETMTTWEHVDSCWGFYGYEYAKETAREQWAEHVTGE